MEPVCLETQNTVFVMIDLQERLVPALSDPDRVVKEAERLLTAARVLKIPVVVTEQYPKGLGPTLESLKALTDSTEALPKTSFTCLGCEGFMSRLESLGRRSVVIFGAESHICVMATALGLKKHGYEVVIADEACGSRNVKHHEAAARAMLAAGIAVYPVESVIYQLLYRAGTPEFKALLPLFK